MCMNNIKNNIKYTYTLCDNSAMIFLFFVKMSNLLRLMSSAYLYTTSGEIIKMK